MSLRISTQLDLAGLVNVSNLPQYGTLDDFAAMAVLATLTVLYLFRGTLWDKPDPYLHKMYERPQEAMRDLTTTQGTRDIGKKLKQMVIVGNHPHQHVLF